MNQVWDDEADVVVVGYGGAGATAAIIAHDMGVKVILLEKLDKPGGNTRYAGGTLREYLDKKKAVDYFKSILNRTVSLEMNQVFVEESAKNPQWMEELGAELKPPFYEKIGEHFPPGTHVIWPHLPGSDGIGGRFLVSGNSKVGGTNLFTVLSRNIDKRGIKVLLNTAAKKLITNEQKEIIGVLADSPVGKIRIKAKRAVILTCGGFQYDREMQLNYLGIDFYAQGCLGNTGDGIRMAQEIGADLWHMSGVSCGIGYKFPEYDMPIGIGIRKPQYIYIDQAGNRFIDEAGTDVHSMAFEFSYLDHKTLTYPRIPAYIIFDENVCKSGPLIGSCSGAMNDYYQWSEDNHIEIERGWIKKADTIRELAPQIGLRPGKLQETVSKYNIYCMGGYDPDFKRPQETLSPISKTPFYAIVVWPCLLNTQGGPKRNSKAQVLDIHGEPIKRLYSAGELGSIFSVLYPGAGNISECLAFGRIAGRNAAAENPWS